MPRKNKEKRVVVLQGDSVRGEKLKGFIAFCLKISDEVCLTHIDLACMTKEEAKEAKEKYREFKIKRYKMEQEEIVEMVQEDEEWLEARSDDFGDSYEKMDERVVRREVTCRTHCTCGGPRVVEYLNTDQLSYNIFENMQNLFDGISLNISNQITLEDPGFFKDGEAIVSICSHETLGYLLLSEEEYIEFKKLRIPHTVQGEVMSLKERLIKCADEGWESLTILGWHEESIPEEIGQIKSLQKLEIFDHEVKHLPKSLGELTALECLRITGNQVEELGFNLAKLKKLKILDFGGMPLNAFPKEVVELKELEQIYLGSIKATCVPKPLIQLSKLQVLSLPEVACSEASPELIVFLEKVKPKEKGISLQEILGEEKWQEIVDKGEYIIVNED